MTLTEQWKKGELKKNKYWVKYKSGKIDTWELSEGITIESKPEIIEVLAPVPSYEEWQELSKQRNHLIRDVKDLAYIQEEKQQLKEEIKMLKEAIYNLDGLECPKCGNYHRRGWTCSQCGYGK